MFDTAEIQSKLQQVDAMLAQGHALSEATSRMGVSQAAYNCWLSSRGGRVGVPLDRLEHLYAENTRLRRTVARLNHELKAMKRRPQLDFFSKALNT